jgi:hypothetical protein
MQYQSGLPFVVAASGDKSANPDCLPTGQYLDLSAEFGTGGNHFNSACCLSLHARNRLLRFMLDGKSTNGNTGGGISGFNITG